MSSKSIEVNYASDLKDLMEKGYKLILKDIEITMEGIPVFEFEARKGKEVINVTYWNYELADNVIGPW